MTELVVRAVITATDHLTGTLKGIAAQVGAIGGQFQAAGKQVGAFGVNAFTAAAAPLAGLATVASINQAELDKQLRLFQAFGDASEDQRVRLRSLVNDVAPRIGVGHTDMIKGATEMIQAGLKPSDLMTALDDKGGMTLLERISAGAMAADTNVSKLATDLVQLAMIGKMPFGTGAEKAGSMEKLLGLAMAAPAFSPDKPGEHMAALRQFAPLLVPMLVGKDPTPDQAYGALTEASALQNTIATMFKGSLGGMGLKTLLQRTMMPTMASEQQMLLHKYDAGKVFGADMSKLRDPDALLGMLKQGGVDMSAHRGEIGTFLADLARDPSGDYIGAKSDMMSMLSGFMPKGSSSWDKGILKRGLDNFFALSKGKFSIEDWLEQLSKLPPDALKDFGGLHHAPKAAGLQGDQARELFQRLKREIPGRAAGAVDQMVGVRNDPRSWDYQTRVLPEAIQTLRNSVWDSGLGEMATAGLAKLNSALQQLSQVDPKVLNMLGTGLTLVGASAAGLVGAGASVWALGSALTALRANPAVLAIAAAGGIGAYVFGQGLASNEGAAALAEYGRLLTNIGGAAASAAMGLANLVNFKIGDGSESPLRKMLKEDAELLNRINSLIERITNGRGQLDKADEPADWNKTTGSDRWKAGGAAQDGVLDYLKSWFQRTPPPAPDPSLSDGPATAPQSALDPAAFSGPIVQRLSSPLAVTLTGESVKAQLEGRASVTVTVQGPGKVTGQSSSGHIELKTGDSMADTNR